MTDRARSMLVVDDEDSICLAFERFFQSRGWKVRSAASAVEGLSAYDGLRPDIVFLDVRLPDRSGLDLLADLAERGAVVVVITAYGGLDTAVRALHGKAYDYLVKPIDLDKALSLADRALETHASRSEADGLARTGRELLVGKAPAMQETYKLIAKVARDRSPVLIQGETGTGKELAAVAIHRFSARRDGPLLAINCGAIPLRLIEGELFGHVRGAFTGADADRVGKFESAEGGSLLLDEIGELPLSVQVKLLRVLDSGTIERVGSSQSIRLDVRLLAATNKDLEGEVEAGRFRRDLYYRLAVLRISMPPLRQRKEDIPLLAEHFMRQMAAGSGHPPRVLGADAREALLRYDWPGNVRELRNALNYALAVAPDRAIRPADLPQPVVHREAGEADGGRRLHEAALRYAAALPDEQTRRYRRTVEQVERALIVDAMRRYGGNQSEAAGHLGLHRNTLRKKLREFRIGPEAPSA